MTSTAPEGALQGVSSRKKLSEKHGPRVSVIAGGAGFLGSHLAEILLAQGDHVVCLDNYTTGKEENLRHLLGHAGFIFKVGDINKSLPDFPRVDHIFHLAGVEEYINGTDVSVETLLVNSIGTKNLLELAREHGAKILLASSTDLYSGVLSSLSLQNYFGSSRDAERFSHHEAKRYAEALTTEYFKKFGVNARIVRLANVYGPRMDLRAGTEMAELIAEALHPDMSKLTVHGDGLKVLHPSYISDVVYGLYKASNLPDTAGKIFNLVSPEPQTVLNIASRLRKVITPHPEIVFTDEIDEARLPAHPVDFESTQKELNWRPVVSLEEGLKRTLAYFKKEKIVPEIPHTPLVSTPLIPPLKTHFPAMRFQSFSADRWLNGFGIKLALIGRGVNLLGQSGLGKRRLRIKAVVAIALTFITISTLVPLGGVVFHSSWGVWRLRGSQSALVAGQADSAFAAASDASSAFASGATELEDLTWILSLFQAREAAESYRHLILAAEEASSAAKYLALATKPLLKLGEDLVKTDVTAKISAEETERDLTEVRTNLEVADDHLAMAEAEIKTVNLAVIPAFAKGQLDYVQEKLTESRGIVAQAREATKVLPDVIGLNGPRSYLLLFTNNTELRPIGGFIGSYGVARFEDGRLRDLFVDDSYNVDGQLTVKPASPQPYKDYLGSAVYGFADSNWSPDFPTTAAHARDLLFQATKRKVDGVISLDLQTVEGLLRVLGPISLADYGETVTADSFFERAQFHADVNFFPGSTAKKDFIGATSRAVLDKLLHSKPEVWPGVIDSLRTSLTGKHLLLTSDNPATQTLLAEANWDGAVSPAGEISETRSGRVEDYLLVVDSNLGMNKANYFIKNQANYQVSADKNGQLLATLTLLYDHTATTETWPSGRYKDYLRVYVPKRSALQKLEISDVKDAPVVSVSEELGLTVFGLFFELPSSTKRTIILTYTLPMKLPTIARESQYNLLIQKQPGQGDVPLSVNFDVPTFLKVTGRGGTNLTSYSLRYNTYLSQDQNFDIDITP